MNSRFRQCDWKPLRQCAHVLSEVANEPTTNCPGRTAVTSDPTSSTKPTYSCSCPIGCGPSIGSAPRYGHRSEPHTQVTAVRTTASVGLIIDLGFCRVLQAHIAGSVDHCSAHERNSLPTVAAGDTDAVSSTAAECGYGPGTGGRSAPRPGPALRPPRRSSRGAPRHPGNRSATTGASYGQRVYWQYIAQRPHAPYGRNMDNRDEVREFLTSRRARVSPEQAGLPDGRWTRSPRARRSYATAAWTSWP